MILIRLLGSLVKMENIIIIDIRNRIIMNNYYYSVQQPLLKQSSQILTTQPMQQQNAHPLRSTLTQRNHHDPKNPYAVSPLHLLQPHISREGSVPHLLDSHPLKHEQPSHYPRNVPNQNQRVLSEYQMNIAGRSEEGLLPTGGGYNITGNKIGEKVKNKTELQRSASRNTLTPNDSNPRVASIRVVQTLNESDKEQARSETAVDQLMLEVARLNERLGVHQERIDRLQRGKREDCGSGIFSSPQMDEINKILSLVEKSEQRDDYKRAIRMIEELRGNILELHSQIKQLTPMPTSELPAQLMENVRDMVASSLKESETQMRKIMEEDVQLLKQRVAGVEEQWGEWKQQQEQQGQIEGNGISSSIKKFEGKMTTLLYQQRLTTHTSNLSKPLKTGEQQGKEDIPVTLTTRTYYLDSSGYLLDKNKFYLLNSNSQQIRLTEKEIAILKKHNIL